MTTQVFRVSRVLTPASSPVARLHAVNAQGHELRLEVPAGALSEAAAGHVLVVQWSVHALPEAMAQVGAEVAPRASSQAMAGQAVGGQVTNGRTVDESFMDLMAGRRGASQVRQPSTPLTSPLGSHRLEPLGDIDDELNTLLGSAPRKG